ncbi:unnamed protein product [Litomosoides sigmodontis]|uniref:Major sperm protein n=1 Tax=Litomosoides sigmodontis TaxID=42156 RepID=A0A3P6SD97_LITSI|nr:unnamed protein product [Litomosoides sigmodontis]
MDASLILQGLIYITLLPSFLITASLIICESSRPQREPAKETISGKKNVTAGSGTIGGIDELKSQCETKSTESTKTQKSTSKSSKSRLKLKKARRLSRANELSKSTKSVERVSPQEARKSSRWERFRKPQTSSTITCNIGEKLKKGMKMEPRLLNWNISGGVQRVYLTNQSNERRAIKVKCSDNDLYRVSHVFTFVEPGEMVSIDILRQNGGAKPDKMIFLFTKAEKSDESASKLFNKVSVYPMLTLPLTVNNPLAD